MADSVTIPVSNASDVRIQALPCNVSKSCNADVTGFFDAQMEANGKLEATLQGRKLVGSTVAAPEGYTFYVLSENKATGQADSMRVFGHDRKAKGGVSAALDYINLAKIMHGAD